MTDKKNKKLKIHQWNKNVILEKDIITQLQNRYDTIDEMKITKFSELPLSSLSQKGLMECGYTILTDIQRQGIGLALRGFDILGAAKTGSGKTLAFLIPVIESLYCKQWTRLDGLGALIITPTRELAYQIYETLRKVGRYHHLSAGLIIGGKDLHFEKNRLNQCNIIICTPGRLLHHMDENPLFDCTNMQVLVLDEADRCLDLGFEKTMSNIVTNLPSNRQTLLYSATQTKSTQDLAKLSLKDPMYVSVHEYATHITPEGLQQSYIVCNLEEKVALLWSFVRNHLKQKTIVFFSTCKQVKFMYQAFCRMRPGISLLALYGSLHQLKRMDIYEMFCRKQRVVLFSTDIAARGLDFPEVDWVVQLDCPEDVNSYIHRAGRTARFQRGGESLLVLQPSEISIVDDLQARKIPISMIKINSNKLQAPQRKLEALLARDCTLKDSAQRAFVAYIKSTFLMRNKKIFNIHTLNTDAYARSLGLTASPRIRFLQRTTEKANHGLEIIEKETEAREKYQTLQPEDNFTINDGSFSEENSKEVFAETKIESRFDSDKDDSDINDELLTIKRKNIQIDLIAGEETEMGIGESKRKKIMTKAAVAKKVLKKKIVPNKKISFDEDGQEIIDFSKTKVSKRAEILEQELDSGINIEAAIKTLRSEDKFDKERYRQQVKKKHREEKRKQKEQKKSIQSQHENEEDESERAISECESESDRPDLSWLPDVDKIDVEQAKELDKNDDDLIKHENYYSMESNKSVGENNVSKNGDQIDRLDKRRLIILGGVKKLKRNRAFSPESSLHADEELALQILRK